MRCITKDLAAQMEACFKQTHIEFTQCDKKGKILELNGGAVCFSGFDSYFSQVVGWGFSTQSKQFKSEIQIIEDFYQTLNHTRVDIELCPFVGNELALFLSQRGYKITELNNVSLLNLGSYKPVEPAIEPFKLHIVEFTQIKEWARNIALGFDYPEAEDQFVQYAQAKGAKAFAISDQDKIISGGTIALHGAFCDLAVTSTLPLYRNKGLQKKLLQARLNFAKKQGLSWALVTTEPGTISDVNVQKVGFQCAYTRIKMTLE
jgi:GNAT superfamily N-acetyltransferase